MCIKATIVTYAFLVKYFKNTTTRAYVGLRVKNKCFLQALCHYRTTIIIKAENKCSISQVNMIDGGQLSSFARVLSIKCKAPVWGGRS